MALSVEIEFEKNVHREKNVHVAVACAPMTAITLANHAPPKNNRVGTIPSRHVDTIRRCTRPTAKLCTFDALECKFIQKCFQKKYSRYSEII